MQGKRVVYLVWNGGLFFRGMYSESRHMRQFFIFLLLYGLWGSACLSAQDRGVPVEALTVIRQGLSQGMVFSVLQTADDFLWVATKDGLNRYDGHRFEVFLPDPFNPFSIASSETRKLFEDKDGNLWIIYVGGIEVYIRKSGSFLHLTWAGEQHFAGIDNYFTQTPDGNVWIADNGYLWKLL